jgi:hypothetical protein
LRIHLILFLTVLFSACSGGKREFASADEAQAYANDHANGFIETVESGGHVFSAKVNPVAAGDDGVTIHVRISRTDGQPVLRHQELTPAEINDMELYLSFDLVQDVYLRVDGKDVAPLLHHYERNYKLKPSVDIAFTFPAVTPQENVQLVYRDNVFGTGLQELEFDKEVFTPYTITK